MDKPYVVGITGGSGSGKTSFARELLSHFKEEATLLALDNYYHPIHLQPIDHNNCPNFDLPASLNLQLFYNDLNALVSGQSINIQEYNFNLSGVPPKFLEIHPNKILLVEGLFIFRKELLPFYDLKIFIDADEEIKLKRRLKRDIQNRGYKQEDVLYCHENHVLPSYLEYIEPQKKVVDLIVNNNENFNKSIEVIIGFLLKKVK